MTTERAVLAGDCFWGVQDLFRRYDGVLVGFTGGNVSHATYRNHAALWVTTKRSMLCQKE